MLSMCPFHGAVLWQRVRYVLHVLEHTFTSTPGREGFSSESNFPVSISFYALLFFSFRSPFSGVETSFATKNREHSMQHIQHPNTALPYDVNHIKCGSSDGRLH